MAMSGFRGRVLGWGLLGYCGLALAQPAEVPEGYRIAQQVLVGDGSVLEVLEDVRITPQLHADSWGNGLDADSFAEPEGDQPSAPLGAQARLVSDSGEVLAQKSLGYPMATVEKAPLNGLPSPAFFLTIDQTAPMGSYSGPATQVLMPEQNQLDPVLCQGEGAEKQPLLFAQTGKAAWQIVPSVGGGTESIQQVSSASSMENEEFVTTYRTFRYADGQWTVTTRQQAGYWDTESEFPEPALFP
ncbi:hypothetical protein [Pseudomonas protegens]|mgnify:FL=1|jgi:hypothetical protein|uniref:hypothetical protein n=1 Tax=Pseudomonas protegens TaxID=380021 RepID=UPI00069DE1AD|nr:hypothetical protein [Pseudomonas protegens]NTZ71834.1 hypothetical protein [Pseudomonas protegens]ROM26158.1 hypothetical protein BK644_11545 [Pseudomonas protegens]